MLNSLRTVIALVANELFNSLLAYLHNKQDFCSKMPKFSQFANLFVHLLVPISHYIRLLDYFEFFTIAIERNAVKLKTMICNFGGKSLREVELDFQAYFLLESQLDASIEPCSPRKCSIKLHW